MSRLSKGSAFCSVASTSQEGLEEAPANRTLKVTLLSSEWKSTKRDSSTINRELAIQLADHPNVEVSVYVPHCSEEDKEIAFSRYNVQLMEAEELPGYGAVDWLTIVPENHAMDCIIGHGVHLGRQIPIIKRYNHHCKWIQIVHTTPEELGMYKTYANAIFKGEKEHKTEVRLCEMADQVVAVGPKLADAYSRSLRPCQKDQEVFPLTPGILSEFSEVKQATEEGNNFVVLLLGRGDSEDFELKGYDIAAKAIAELNDMSCHLMFVGAPTGKEEEVKEKFLCYGISPAQLTIRCFEGSREGLAKLLCEVDLAIMPSRTEGFGLTALEALSAGLPVLVSGNSGLGEAFKKVATGKNWIVASEEPKDWAKAISAVREEDRDIRLEECEILREKYGAKYSWQEQCYSLVEAMQKISFACLGLSAECESVKLKGNSSSQTGGLDPANVAKDKRSREEIQTITTAANNDAIPTSEEGIFRLIIKKLFQVPLSSFIQYLSTRSIDTQDVNVGSLLITVKCRSLLVLEDLWIDYTSGHLNEMVQKCLVTEDILNDLGLSELKLCTTIREADYKACKQILQKSVIISHDSKKSKEPRNQKSKDTRTRRDGTPSWCDKDVNTKYHEVVMAIPKGKTRLIVGKKGWRIKDIKEQTGVKELNIRDDQVHIRGTEEQCSNAKKIIHAILKGQDNPDQDSWKKLDFIPEKYMGAVIGKSRWGLRNIEQTTGAILKVHTSSLHIKGSIESQKRAIRKIKEEVNFLRHFQSGKRKARLVYVDTTQLDLDHEFELSRTTLTCHSGAAIYKVNSLGPSSQDMEDLPPDITVMKKLSDGLRSVLENIHREQEEEKVIVDIWCHFGHVYITRVDEADEEEQYFTLQEIKEKLEDKELGWTSIFKEGLEKVEVEQIEKNLESRASKEEIRYDLTFYSPSCRYVRVKVWLSEKDGGGQEGDKTTSMAFCRKAPFGVMNVMTHVSPDEQDGDTSYTPCFYMCAQSQKRMKMDIWMPSKECDSQLFIKTSPVTGVVPRTSQEEEEDKILESYLMGMKIKEGQLTLPPVSERPDGFDLFYQRRSRRRIYEYEMDDEKFTLLISKYQEKTVDAAETEASDFDEIDTEVDIHIHCKEWDRLLVEGNWKPEKIVAKLPTFMKFLRTVQSSVAP